MEIFFSAGRLLRINSLETAYGTNCLCDPWQCNTSICMSEVKEEEIGWYVELRERFLRGIVTFL